jgi:acylglycerol lipase
MTQELTNIAREERVEGAGGLEIFIRSWRPDGRARGIVAIVPGFNSHGGYYGWVAEQLVADGLAVYAVDLRGRGKSDGERFFVEKFEDYVSDVQSLIKLARSREPGLPVFLLGHSAGGVVSCVYTLDHQAELAGLICEDFAFQVPAPDVALAILKGLSHVAPHVRSLCPSRATVSPDRGCTAAALTEGRITMGSSTNPMTKIEEIVDDTVSAAQEFVRRLQQDIESDVPPDQKARVVYNLLEDWEQVSESRRRGISQTWHHLATDLAA